MAMNKSDVKSIEDVRLYLREQAQKNKRLYHYTTYESLLAILSSNTFRLSRMDLLNDKAEKKLGSNDERMSNYSISFTQKKEYVSMWAMYGKPSGLKIRLDFDKALLFNEHTKLYYDGERKNRISFPKPLFEIKDLADRTILSDVVYYDKENEVLKHNTRGFPNLVFNNSQTDKLTGLIKYDAWEFEKETRFNVRLDGKFRQFDDFPEYIFIGFEKELVSTFRITFNPWMSNLVKEELKKSLDSLTGIQLKYLNSANDGEIEEF